MEGLGAAASGIAVVSLAIQLVDSVREIQRFLRSIAEAPEELSRLIDLLEQLQLILESAGRSVTHQRAQHGELDMGVSRSILKAVQTCEKRLEKLRGLIDRAKDNMAAKCRGTKLLGRFRLAYKKEDVEDLEMELLRALNTLNVVLTLNLSTSHSHGMQKLFNEVSSTNNTVAAISQEIGLIRSQVSAPSVEIITAQPQAKSGNPSTKSRSLRRPFTQKIVYRGILGIIAARSRSTPEDPSAKTESSWIIIPSFLSRCVQVQCTTSFGWVERRFREYPVISDNHPVWDICERGDVASLQQLFTRREVSTYSVNSWGRTLLHAAFYHCFETCALVLSLGLGAEVVDLNGNRPSGGVVSISHEVHSVDPIERTYRVLIESSEDLDLSEFCFGYFQQIEQFPVECFSSQIYKWATEENVNRFHPSPLAVVANRLSSLSVDDSEKRKWMDISTYLIAKNTKIHVHKHGIIQPTSLLDDVMDQVYHPFDSQAIGAALLEILRAENLDIEEFLQIELETHLDSSSPSNIPRLNPWGSRVRLLQISFQEPISLSWDWWVDPEGSAFEALYEFRSFGSADGGCFSYDDGPYFEPHWYESLYCFEHGCNLPEDDITIGKLFHSRFERRWRKKMTKLAKIQGTYKKPKKSKMPGTWMD